MAQVTRATTALDRAGVSYRLVSYNYHPGAERIGLQAAEALGVDPNSVIKTLMTKVDGQAVCVMLSSAAEVSMKSLASAVGGKKAEMMPPAVAERISGYRIGGISAFAAFPWEISLAFIGIIFSQGITMGGYLRMVEDFGVIRGTGKFFMMLIKSVWLFQAHILTHVSGVTKAANGRADYVSTGRGPGCSHLCTPDRA